MLNFNLVKTRQELEAEVMVGDDEMNSQYAIS